MQLMMINDLKNVFSFSENCEPSLLDKSTFSYLDDCDSDSLSSLRRPLDVSSMRGKKLFSKFDEDTD